MPLKLFLISLPFLVLDCPFRVLSTGNLLNDRLKVYYSVLVLFHLRCNLWT